MALNDDAVAFNTRSSTQWDGFRHYECQKTKQFYQDHVQNEFDALVSEPLGIDAYAEDGGIVGRSVHLDWYSWSQANNQVLSPFAAGAIGVEDLKAIAPRTISR